MAKKDMTIEEFARMGGKARWKDTTKEERQEHARKAVKARWDRRKKAKATA